MARPPLTAADILHYADVHRRCAGSWPSVKSGRVLWRRGEDWRSIDNALRYGLRGLPGGSSLARFLAEHRGSRNKTNLPPLTVRTILAWADEHRRRTGAWPNMDSGPVRGAEGETWAGVNQGLVQGCRGLPGGTSLARLLARRRRARNHTNIQPLRPEQILAWADAYHLRTGRWPHHTSGPVPEAPGQTWAGVESALQKGLRGLPPGGSLYRFLREHRQIPGPRPRPRLRRVKTSPGTGRCTLRIDFPPEILERCRSGELSVPAVAQMYGVCRATARRELVLADVPITGPGRPPGRRPALHVEVLRRYGKGQSMPRIAGELNLTAGRVCTILRRYGVDRRPAGPDFWAGELNDEGRRRLGDWLREHRLAVGLTQDQAADEAGVRSATVSALETGRVSPTRQTMETLARALWVGREALASMLAALCRFRRPS